MHFENLDTATAALRLGLSVSLLENLRLTDHGPAFLKIGRRVVYRVADLDAWAGQHVVRGGRRHG